MTKRADKEQKELAIADPGLQRVRWLQLKQQSTTEILIYDKRAQVHREDWAIICNIQSSFFGMILK